MADGALLEYTTFMHGPSHSAAALLNQERPASCCPVWDDDGRTTGPAGQHTTRPCLSDVDEAEEEAGLYYSSAPPRRCAAPSWTFVRVVVRRKEHSPRTIPEQNTQKKT